MSPLVSILVPVYNRVDLIEATLRSALAQHHAPLEVVAVDNASEDGTWELLQRLAGEDNRLRVFRNATNLGPVRNWLACLERARGPLAKILWSDDLMDPRFLSEAVPLLARDDVGFVYSPTGLFGAAHGEVSAPLFVGPGPGVHPSALYIGGALCGDEAYPLSPGCALFRTEDLRRNLRLHVPNRIGSDFSMHAIGNDLLAFLLTARDYPRFAVLDGTLSFFRDHAGSITSGSSAARIVLHYDVARAHFAETGALPPGLLERFEACLWLRLRRFDGRPWGLRRVSDFYSAREARPRARAIATEVLRRIRRRVWAA